MTIYSWLNFGRSAPREWVCDGAKIFGSAARRTTATAQCLRIFERFFIQCCDDADIFPMEKHTNNNSINTIITTSSVVIMWRNF